MYMYIKHYVDKNSIDSSSSYILNKQCSSPLEIEFSYSTPYYKYILIITV